MVKLLIRLCLFLCLLGGIKGLAWWSFQRPLQQNITSEMYKSVQFDSLRLHYNTVFLGSSRTYTSIIPEQFDSLTHLSIHSYNYGASSFFAPHTFQLAETLLRRPDLGLRYVCVELSLPNPVLPEEPLMFDPLAELSYRVRLWRYYDDLTSGPTRDTWLNGYLLALLSPSTCLFQSKPYWQNLLFGTGSKPLTEVDTNANVPYDYYQLPNGYIRDKRLQPAFWAADTALLPTVHQLTRQMISTCSTSVNTIGYWTDIARLMRLADERNIRLLFYLPNRPTVGEARLLGRIFDKLPASNRLSIPPGKRFDQLFARNRTFNVGHLNHNGAQLYTTLLVEAFERAVAMNNSHR